MLPPTKAERRTQRWRRRRGMLPIVFGVILFAVIQTAVKIWPPAHLSQIPISAAPQKISDIGSSSKIQDRPDEAAPLSAPCSAELFQISDERFVIYNACRTSDCTIVKIAGMVTNKCDAPFGVQMRVTAFDRAGKLVDTEQGWPFSTSNIPPNRKTPFNLDTIITYQKSMVKFSVEAVEVKQWNK